ncbi:MAG: hypothetical protein J5826_01870 [Bacteroidales bacterium]|nr:hypothetical protein [Bacteroidales bacterium]
MTQEEALFRGTILEHLNSMSKKSEEMIAEQQNTNQELNMLRNQMANANSMQQQMLQNQIREIEEKEIQKFYKLRSFKLNQLATCIDNLTDINQKAFTYYVFKDIITERATEAQSKLNEISDKEYCNSTLAKLRGIYQQIGDIRQLSIAEYLMRFINSKAEYDQLCNALSNAKSALNTAPPMMPNLKMKLNNAIILLIIGVTSTIGVIGMYLDKKKADDLAGLFIPIICFAIMVYIYLKEKKRVDQANNNYQTASASYESIINDARQRIATLENQIAHCDYVQTLQYFFSTYPTWKMEINNDYKMLEN